MAGPAGHWLLSERFPARWRDFFEGPMGLAPTMRAREFVLGLAVLCADGGLLSEDVMASRIRSFSEQVLWALKDRGSTHFTGC